LILFLAFFRANEEIAKAKRSNEAEMVVLQAALRKAEMQAQSLEQTVEQKVGFFKIVYRSTVEA
jgi:hypothetical protein